ncbi:MAG: DUF1003 domain-containing protein [Elsteraceae bacterium]
MKRHVVKDDEIALLEKLRANRLNRDKPALEPPSRGQRIADKVAEVVGSWRFIVIQSSLLALWIIANVLGFIQHWDPYPFILLNLALSFQAAYTAPIIMMSQNRQAVIDRLSAKQDYTVNLKAELEIELLHQKLDLLRDQEIKTLIETVTALRQELAAVRGK